MELCVLHADNHLLVVVKPAGLPTVPDATGDASLLDLAKAWVKRAKEKRGEAYLGVVHRLDRPVSGVVVFARTSKAAARLTEAFRSRTVKKGYWGVSVRAPSPAEGTLEQWLWKDPAKNHVRVVCEGRPGAQRAVTNYRVGAEVGEGPRARILLELEPLTGRAHQLRVAAASLGCALLGDLKYGARAPLPDKSIGLHARALEFAHPTGGEPLRFECAPPARPWWRF
jgi:23S rRNA pseudouridine1911/1915/1917 synthase